jgi:hypothetical protein
MAFYKGDVQRMNILVLGNGFDLAHNLPTKYTDFLKFTQVIKNILTLGYKPDYLVGLNNDIKEVIKIEVGNKKDNLYDKKEEWLDLIIDNLWLKYFYKSERLLKDSWIDFENEISKVIQALEIALIDENRDLLIIKDGSKKSDIIKVNFKQDFIFSFEGSYTADYINYERICERFLTDLKKLIRALEMYLADYVDPIVIEVISPDIEAYEPDKVLCFNYTDTYKPGYEKGREIEYDFIHGTAKSKNTIEANNMVLGIDNYKTNVENDITVNLEPFKKYFQRLHRRTDSKYREWIDEIRSGKESELEDKVSNLYIFGHSLDTTDKDVLRTLILCDRMQTTIFYYDEKDYRKKLQNMVKMIGSQELEDRTGGLNKSIIFKKQNQMKYYR